MTTWICCECNRWNTMDTISGRTICGDCKHKRCSKCKNHKEENEGHSRSIGDLTVFSGFF